MLVVCVGVVPSNFCQIQLVVCVGVVPINLCQIQRSACRCAGGPNICLVDLSNVVIGLTNEKLQGKGYQRCVSAQDNHVHRHITPCKSLVQRHKLLFNIGGCVCVIFFIIYIYLSILGHRWVSYRLLLCYIFSEKYFSKKSRVHGWCRGICTVFPKLPEKLKVKFRCLQ